MDFLDALVEIFMPMIAAAAFGLMVFAIVSAGTSAQPHRPTKTEKICHALNGHIVEDVCIRDGKVVYKK